MAVNRIPGFATRRLTQDQPESSIIEASASTALPADGAFDDPAFIELPLGARHLCWAIDYTGGAAGGSLTFRLEWGLDEEALGYNEASAETALVAAEPFATRKTYAAQYLGPVAGATLVRFLLVVPVPPGCRFVRLLKAEIGAVGTPGTARVRLKATALS